MLPAPLRESLLLLLAVASMASSVIFIRLSELGPFELAGWRLAGGALAMAPLVRGWGRLGRGAWVRAWVAGLLLGLHFVTWVVGARSTSAANASLLVNLVPLVLPLLLVPLAHESIRGRDWAGAACGVAGVLVVVGANLHPGGTAWGDGVCLGSMLLYAAYMALGRRAATLFPNTASWIVLVFGIGAVVCFGAGAAAGAPLRLPPPAEWLWVVALVVFPTLLGHGLMNRALRCWRGQVVGVASTGQFLFAGLFAWPLFGELPSVWFPLGAALVVAGVWIVAKGK